MAAARDSDSDDADLRALQDLLGPRKGGRQSEGVQNTDGQLDVESAERAGAGPEHPGLGPSSLSGHEAAPGSRSEVREPGAPVAGDARAAVPAHGDAPGAGLRAEGARGDPRAADEGGAAGLDDGREAADARDVRSQAAVGQPPRPWPMANVIEAEPAPAHALSPLDPAIGLADRLHADRLLSVPVRPWPRVAAAGLAGLFLVLWVLSLRASALGHPWPDAGWPASAWFFALAVGAAGAFAGMAKLWPARELRLPLAPNQHEQVTRIEAQARAMQRLVWTGAAASLAGLLVLGAGFAFAPPGGRAAVLALGSLAVAGGAVATVAGLARWLPMRMLYVQTLVLQRLEALGLGDQLAMDPRTANVILALDGLLGKLPESAVRQFLSRPEAEWYLELVGRLKGGRGGR